MRPLFMYKTVMRRCDERSAAVTAGIGHGGIEAMTVSAASMALYQFGYIKELFPVELWLIVCALYALRSARKCYLEECDA